MATLNVSVPNIHTGNMDVFEISFFHNVERKTSGCLVRLNNRFFNCCSVENTDKNYSKDRMRKEAMKQALFHATRNARSHIYEAYRTMTKVPRWSIDRKRSKSFTSISKVERLNGTLLHRSLTSKSLQHAKNGA